MRAGQKWPETRTRAIEVRSLCHLQSGLGRQIRQRGVARIISLAHSRMALNPGARIGAYEVVSLLGAGGMGEVYRARDTRLGRDIALKILPEAFSRDADRVARFEREAKTLASFSHPHIGAIHGIEEAAGVTALVLELVDGPTLADRIAAGPMPLDEMTPIARQIAEALQAAHEHRIVHRDLKPANIKIREDGTVKVLDFGLAKAIGSPEAGVLASAALLTQSPTISLAATQAGMILGTAPYMSPEQARGRPADKRSDIWAFGCIVFEMLTGRRAFDGEDVPDTLANVMKADPDVPGAQIERYRSGANLGHLTRWAALSDDQGCRERSERALAQPHRDRELVRSAAANSTHDDALNHQCA